MALNLQALRVFAAVAERGGFSRAAAVLHLSQPAVSRAVLGLERDVGLPLLERGARGVRLTDAGAALYARARELFAVERTAEEEVRAQLGLAAGVLRVGASTTVATYYLPALLGEFRAAHPGVRLVVASTNTRAVARLLLQRRLDVALVEGPVRTSRIAVRAWRDDELVVIASPAHPLAHEAAVVVTRLADEPFLVRERGSGTRTVAARALAAHGIRPPTGLTLGSTAAIAEAVAAGLGLAMISRAAATSLVQLGRLVVLPICDGAGRALDVRRPLSELRLPERAPSAPAAAFGALLWGAS